jgi:hypothetical protein
MVKVRKQESISAEQMANARFQCAWKGCEASFQNSNATWMGVAGYLLGARARIHNLGSLAKRHAA